jgi:hypothetical protein
MVSILSIGFARRRSWRTAQRQNEATAARLRVRVDGAGSAGVMYQPVLNPRDPVRNRYFVPVTRS